MNNALEEYLKSPEATNISIKAHESVLRRYTLTLNGNGPNSGSAIDFLKSLKGLSLTSLGVYKCILERFLSWNLNYKVTLSCPWITMPLSEYMKEYYSNEPRKTLTRESRVFSRRNGKVVCIKGRKRNRPNDICELCDRPIKRLDYHHWDDNNLLRGMWLCQKCHQTVAELIDRQGLGGSLWLIEKYVKLKEEIDLTCNNG